MFSNKIKRYRGFIKLSAVVIVIVLGMQIMNSVKFLSEVNEIKAVDESAFKEEYPGRSYVMSISSAGSEVKPHPSMSTMRITLTSDGEWIIYPTVSDDLKQLPPQTDENIYSPKALFIYTHLFTSIFFSFPIILILALTLVFLLNIHKDSTPFTGKNAKLLKIISYIVLAYGALGRSVVASAVYKWVFNADWLGTGMKDADWTIVAFGILLYMISVAFSHGIYLQEEFDDTV